MDCKNIFAQRIKGLRENNGLGVNQLASILGIGASSLSQYENCKRTPDIDVCRLFAVYFNVSCDYLIGLDDNPRK